MMAILMLKDHYYFFFFLTRWYTYKCSFFQMFQIAAKRTIILQATNKSKISVALCFFIHVYEYHCLFRECTYSIHCRKTQNFSKVIWCLKKQRQIIFQCILTFILMRSFYISKLLHLKRSYFDSLWYIFIYEFYGNFCIFCYILCYFSLKFNI